MSNNKTDLSKFAILFIPWLLAVMLQGMPVVSYIVAWLGSFFIFAVTLTGAIKPLPTDKPLAGQMMRPIFIIQIIFAGYMCCTSIFYFLNLQGFDSISNVNRFVQVDENAVDLAAQCQRYYCLAHASFVAGILRFMNYPSKHRYYVEKQTLAGLLMRIALIAFPVSVLFLKVPGLAQFSFQFSSLSFIAGTLALAFAIPQRKLMNTLICLALYLFNFYQAFISGFKEPIIISVLVLGIFLYPNYKRLVTLVFVPAIIILFLFLPAYVSAFRQSNWSGDETAENASQAALNEALNQDEGNETYWGFLVYRLSEIDMFTKFIQSTPDVVPYYGLDLIKQSAIAIIPRILWPSKPITEDLVMIRVYNAGVVNRNSAVSAKPAYVVDAYLSFGGFGIFIFLFAYGAAAQLISVKAEKLFGGYTLGTALIFSGLFQIFWRGLSFEFLINSVFWSYISMLVIFKILLKRNIIKEH